MSKLEELIQKYCPDGVEYRPLGNATIMQRGTSATKGMMQDGEIPVISGGRQPAFFCNQSNRVGETITVAGSGAGAGYVQYWNKPIFVCDAFSVKGGEGLSTKFVYYFLSSIQEKIYSTKKGGGVPHVHISSIDKFEIPVPPLPVQEEIVRVLDSFTELQAELQAELQNRLLQYNYYRDNLLSFEGRTDVEWKRLREIEIKHCSGSTPAKERKDYYDNGTIPWLRTQDVKFNEIKEISSFITETAVKETAVKWIPENCVIIAISGATAGRCAINKFRTTTNQHCLNIEVDKNKAYYKYVFYCVANQYNELLSLKQGARGDLNSSSILNMRIPVPSLPEQENIASILDRFDSLTNDLTAGLPAEIEARRQQYEFYRDKLLTFKRV